MGKQTYIFPVKEVRDEKPSAPGQLEKTYVIATDERGANGMAEIDLDDNEHYYQFVYNDNTTWISDGNTINDLFGQSLPTNRGEADVVRLPLTLENGADRGYVGKIVLKLIHVFAKPAKDRLVIAIAKDLEDKQLQGREGLNKLNQDFGLVDFVARKNDAPAPYLLFIHGTNSNTNGAFEGLVQNGFYKDIYSIYKERILAFQHRTLTVSPLQNAVELMEALPDNATLHIISHSRGGLVGEILNLYAAGPGFSEVQCELLQKEAREADLANIAKLRTIFSKKKITVEKFIRVASPSAGTLLASERIDHILNVLFNLVEGTIADLLGELIGAVLKEKSNIDTLPGLEAMNPQSPFIKVLNAQGKDIGIDGAPLMVISGNGKLSFSFKGLLVILGKLFYLQRSDLVVNTDSMYLGVKRLGLIQYYFDEAANVDHIHYFDNLSTQRAVLNALNVQSGKPVPGFKSVEQLAVPASDRGALGMDIGELFPDKNPPSGKKPILVLLPGIMGSNIYEDGDVGDRMWLNYWRIINGGLDQMTKLDNPKTRALSVVKTSYKKLQQHLSFKYDVVIFPFDWRKPMEESARELDTTMRRLLQYNQPIKMVGHSMGGVLIRDFIVYHDETWRTLNSTRDFRIVFLGAPLRGSHRIPAVLFGKDGLINKLDFLDRRHTKKELISFFTQLPGILALLPLTQGQEDYSDIATWNEMRKALGDPGWPIPDGDSLLDNFRIYRDKVLAANFDFTNMVYIAGQDKETACGYVVENGELVFEYTAEGDHSVTWESGIPGELIAKNQVYYVDVTHGALANEPDIFTGIDEILQKGSTKELSQKRPIFRNAQQRFRVHEHSDFDFSVSGLENSVLGLSPAREVQASQTPIAVSVSHGDLTYASFPVLAGHFKNDAILYAELAIDRNLNSMLQNKLKLGGYPGDIETNEIIFKRDNFFEGAIIVGLGEPGKLTSHLLARTVEVGVSNYLLGLTGSNRDRNSIGISALLIGSGYGGLAIENSIKAIIEGVNNANRSIRAISNENYTVSHIEFIEQYAAKANSTYLGLKKIEDNENDNFNVITNGSRIKTLFGCRTSLSLQGSEEWWNRMVVKTFTVQEHNTTTKFLRFNSSTGDARDEEDDVYSNTKLVEGFIESISLQNNWSESLAKSLFEMLIPNNFKDRLKRKGHITWVLDKESAAYPWELLQDSSLTAKPLCIDAGMIRQLSTQDYNPNSNRYTSNKALVIADPKLDNFLNQLEGAQNEGKRVQQLLVKQGYDTVPLIGSTAPKIAEYLYADSYKIIHLAGHGIYNPNDEKNSGMVIGKQTFIRPADIKQLPAIPELAFVNCCHLGRMSGVNNNLFEDRYKFAANMGTELINSGVKAVIVAGWQVNDDDALAFATTFYEKMFGGETFGNAVMKARRAIYKGGTNNTWGAYQCYGDPYYKLENRSGNTAAPEKKVYYLEDEVLVDLQNLYQMLDVRNTKVDWVKSKLEEIIEAKNEAKLDNVKFDELEAAIFYELGDYKTALQKYVALMKREDATFSVTALEKYCSSKSYKYFEAFYEKPEADRTPKDRQEAIAALTAVMNDLSKLFAIGETNERRTIKAGNYKRLAYLSEKGDKRTNYKEAVALYQTIYEQSKGFYPLNNYLIFQTILDFNNLNSHIKHPADGEPGFMERLESKSKSLANSSVRMDYWESADYTSSLLSMLFLDKNRAAKNENWEFLAQEYIELRKKFGSPGKKKAELYNLNLIIDAFKTIVPARLNASKHALQLQRKMIELRLAVESAE